MRTRRPRRRPPLVLSPVALSELTEASVECLLRPFADRVVLERERLGVADVGLVDPDQPPETWHRRAGLPLVALTRDGSAESAERAAGLGATASLGPDLSAAQLIEAVEDVLGQASGECADDLRGLSARELEVVSLICRGHSNAEIADILFLSPNSVKTYIRVAYRKMGVSSRSQAVLWGYHRGL
jgi:DNA-binding CsgD family transcriptional regulator